MKPSDILNEIFVKARIEYEKDQGKDFLTSLDEDVRNRIYLLVNKSTQHKGVITVLITSLVKKIDTPEQDIRFHKTGLQNGYSGRSYDTKFITPFLKNNFPRIAMKESGWLTRSLEQLQPFTMDFRGRIRDQNVKNAFLVTMRDIEENKLNPKQFLVGLFIQLLKEKQKVQTLISSIVYTNSNTFIEIQTIVNSLEEHFFSKEYHSHGASKLPVIAIHTIYEIMINEMSRFNNKKLLPLRSHLAADTKDRSTGDIEIVNNNNDFYEAVEIKHDIPIDLIMLNDAYKKFRNYSLSRFYLLTTAEPYIDSDQKEQLKDKVDDIRNAHNCEVILNGVLHSIRYYLRMLNSPEKFISLYTENLKKDISESSEIKKEHLEKWNEILKRFAE